MNHVNWCASQSSVRIYRASRSRMNPLESGWRAQETADVYWVAFNLLLPYHMHKSRLKIKSPLTTNEFVKPLEFVFFLLFRIYKKDPWWNNFGDNKTKTLNEKRSRAKDKLLLQTAKLRATKPPRWQFRKIYEEVQEIVRDIIVVCCPHKVLSNIVISFTTGWRRPFDKFASSFSHCSS